MVWVLHTNTYTTHNQNNFIPCGHFTPGHIAHAKVNNANDIPWNQKLVKTLYLIEELTALFIKFLPVIVSTIIFLAHDFNDELQP